MNKTTALLLVALALALGPASCSSRETPEDFCHALAVDSCAAFLPCCDGNREFSLDGCRGDVFLACMSATHGDLVAMGQAIFDPDAAHACFQAPSCTRLRESGATFAERKACATMATGLEILGSTCTHDVDCAKAGELSVCYRSQLQSDTGTCAQVVIDSARCAFSPHESTLRICPEDMFCDILARQPAFDDMMTETYSAPCKKKPAAGESCVDTRNDTALLPCQEGLYCEVTGSDVATCVAKKPLGAACGFDSGVDECESSLYCMRTPSGTGTTCVPFTAGRPHCEQTTNCGDGLCQPGEETNCAEDCGVKCLDCACHISIAQGGCLEACDQNAGGGSVPDLCNTAPITLACRNCLEQRCGSPDQCSP
ncbi:hypothetical protein A7982_12137 [Minicystis rosea]|nr:hypothetical protein A7982_12137 [Minicystis rosea]